jgi:uncharacterized membrane protein YgdD (TMEM256/DUF423 family)
MKENLKYKTLIGIASTVFCVGFLMSIVDGYYEYYYYHFIEIGRKDLIARLGFLSWTTGLIYYPLVIVILLLTSYLLERNEAHILRKQWIHLTVPALLVGILFYSHSIDIIIMKDMRFWRIGLSLMGLSILTYWILLRTGPERKLN